MAIVPGRGSDADAYSVGWARAHELADYLRGGELPGIQSPLILQPGETMYSSVDVEIAVFTSVDVDAGGGAFVAGSTWKGLAVTAGASMLWNAKKRREAEAMSQAQWRSFGMGSVHVTNQRVLFPIEGQLSSHWLQGGVLAFEPLWSEYMAVIHLDAVPPIAFRGPAATYLSVLLCTLLFGTVPEITNG